MANLDLESLRKMLEDIAKAIVAIGAIFAAVSAFSKKYLKPFWTAILKPFLKLFVASITLIVPMGYIIWLLLYWIVRNRNIFTESIVLVQLVMLPTVFISLYALLWGIVIYPKLILPRFKKQQLSTPQTLGNNQSKHSEGAPKGDDQGNQITEQVTKNV